MGAIMHALTPGGGGDPCGGGLHDADPRAGGVLGRGPLDADELLALADFKKVLQGGIETARVVKTKPPPPPPSLSPHDGDGSKPRGSPARDRGSKGRAAIAPAATATAPSTGARATFFVKGADGGLHKAEAKAQAKAPALTEPTILCVTPHAQPHMRVDAGFGLVFACMHGT
jgi:hypothetical protein